MPDLYDLVKRIALKAVEASDPVAIMVGRVTQIEPLLVMVEQRLPLTKEFLMVPKRLRGELKKGDGVLILREQGGQRYAVLDIL